MISIPTVDSFGTPNPPSGDPADADGLNDRFALLLTVPVSAPPPALPIADAPDAAPVEVGNSSLFTSDPASSLPEIARPSIQADRNYDFPASAPSKIDGFAIPKFLQPVGVELTPTRPKVFALNILEKPPADSLPEVLGLAFAKAADPQPSSLAKGLDAKHPQLSSDVLTGLFDASPPQPKAIIDPVITSGPNQAAKAAKDSADDKSLFSTGNLFARDDIAVSDDPRTVTRPLPQKPGGPSAVHAGEIVAESPVPAGGRAYFALNVAVSVFTAVLHPAFKEVSGAVKNVDLLKAAATSDLPPEENLGKQANQSFLSDSGQAFGQTTIETPTLYKETEKPGSQTDAVFSTSLNIAVKGRRVVEKAIVEQPLPTRIIEQVEPRVAALAEIMPNGGERRVLKMRLTPPELGTVEITLQKNSGGRIDAHFRTDSQDARRVLADSLGQLRESLERSGIHVGDLDTSCSSFSATGNDGRRQQPNSPRMSDLQPGEMTNFDGISQDDGDDGDRLVNLRA